jgi:RNA polymerase sigma factor (TIGR02999 family)
MAREAPGHTLEPTALVHEAYLRLIGSDGGQAWENRKHFFAAAAEAMRRVLIENARRKGRLRHGRGQVRVRLEDDDVAVEDSKDDVIAMDEVLSRLEAVDADAAQLVKLRYFTGLTMAEAAEVLGVSLRKAERNWTYARTWLHRELGRGDDGR